MGKKKTPITVIIDTNVLLSALLFKGKVARIVELWKEERICPAFTRETFEEFNLALQYPKFSLSVEEIKAIVEEEVLPYFHIVEATVSAAGVCSDSDDDKFISGALSASAAFIVTGDKKLLSIKEYRSVRVITVSDFLKLLDS